MKRILLPLLATLLVAGLAVLTACSDSTDPVQPAQGRLVLNLTDASCDYDEVNIVVIGVRVHRAGSDDGENPDEGGEWITVSDDTFTVDLLTLSNGQSIILTDTLLAAGKYTQVRLLLDDGCTVVVAGEPHDLEVPSGEQSGLKLNHPFTLSPDFTYGATLDFDACRSVHLTGNDQYKMKPVIRIVVDAISGGLRGTVLPVDARAMIWAVADSDSALAWADTLTGEYLFSNLEAGQYDVSFEPTAGDYADSTVTGVTVTAEMVTDMGTTELQGGVDE